MEPGRSCWLRHVVVLFLQLLSWLNLQTSNKCTKHWKSIINAWWATPSSGTEHKSGTHADAVSAGTWYRAKSGEPSLICLQILLLFVNIQLITDFLWLWWSGRSRILWEGLEFCRGSGCGAGGSGAISWLAGNARVPIPRLEFCWEQGEASPRLCIPKQLLCLGQPGHFSLRGGHSVLSLISLPVGYRLSLRVCYTPPQHSWHWLAVLLLAHRKNVI